MADSLATIRDALIDALDYEETASLSKAKIVITRASQLLVRRPNSSSGGGTAISWDVTQLRSFISDARGYVEAKTAGRAVRLFDMREDWR